MNKFVFCRNEDGSWKRAEPFADLSYQIKFAPEISNFRAFEGSKSVRLDLDDMRKFLKSSSADRISKFSEIVGDALLDSVIRNAGEYLDSLSAKMKRIRNESTEIRTVTEEEYQNASDYLDENRNTVSDTEKLFYDFEQLLESESHLVETSEDCIRAEENLSRLLEKQNSLKEDRLTLGMYGRVVKGCQVEYSKMKASQNSLSRLEQEYCELKTRYEELQAVRDDVRSRHIEAEQNAEDFLQSRSQRENAISSALRLDGSIAIQRQRRDAFIREVDEKKSELSDTEDRLLSLKNRISSLENEIGSLLSYLDQNSDLDRCCLELDKVVECMTKYIEMDARVRSGENELAKLETLYDEKKKKLAEAREHMDAASRDADASDFAMENIITAKNSADQNPADLKITSIGRNIDFLNSLQPEIDRFSRIIDEHAEILSKLDETKQKLREFSDSESEIDEKVKNTEAERERISGIKAALSRISELERFRQHLCDGEQCPLCGGVVSGLEAFVRNVSEDTLKINSEYLRLTEELDLLRSNLGQIAKKKDEMRQILADTEPKYEQICQTLNFSGRELNDRTAEIDIPVRWDNGDGVFSHQSVSVAVAQIRNLIEAYTKEFNDLLHLKDRNDKTFRDYTVLKNSNDISLERVSECRRAFDACQAECIRSSEDIKNLKSDLDVFHRELDELNHSLTGYMDDKWEKLCNSFIRDNLSVSEKESAIVEWKQQCLYYISKKDEYERKKGEYSNLLTEEEVARSNLEKLRENFKQIEDDRILADDELKELEHLRSKTLDDTVEHAMEVMSADAYSSDSEFKNASMKYEQISGEIANVEKSLKQLAEKIDDCKDDISQSQKMIREFVENNPDFNMDIVDELMERDSSFYENLRNNIEEIEDEIEASQIALDSARVAKCFYEEEYAMRLRSIPNVSADDITDGILSHEWIDKTRQDRAKIADEIRRNEQIVHQFRDELKQYEESRAELEDISELVEFICGDPEDSNEEYENGFSRLSKNVTVKRLADMADAYLARITDQYRFKTVKESTAHRSLILEVVDIQHSGSMVSFQNVSPALMFKTALSVGLGILELTGIKSDVDTVIIDDGSGSSDDPEVAEQAVSSLDSVLDGHEGIRLVLFSGDEKLAGKFESAG